VYSLKATVAAMYFYGGVLMAAAAFAVTSYLLMRYPAISAESLTILMAAYFIIGGAFEVIAPLVTSSPDAGWHVLNGVFRYCSE
jgi:uncharacterized membrane protein HdeD (DUF308 family)